MKSIYNPDKNILEEIPEMGYPNDSNSNYRLLWGEENGEELAEEYERKYNEQKALCKKYTISGTVPEYWRGEVLEENIDYELKNKEFSIYSGSGTLVTTNELLMTWGNSYDEEKAKKYLKPNEIYTILKTEVHSWNTNVCLKEMPDIRFNSIHFCSPEIIAVPLKENKKEEVKKDLEDVSKPFPQIHFPEKEGMIYPEKEVNESQDELRNEVYDTIYRLSSWESVKNYLQQFSITRINTDKR